MNEHPFAIEIRALEAEIERLKANLVVVREVSSREIAQCYEDLGAEHAEIERLKALLTGAAEMLETLGCKGPKVAELRKAAE